MFFEPIHPCAIYQSLDYLKSHNKFCEDNFVSKVLPNNEILWFSESEAVEEKIVDTVPKKSIENEPPFPLIEDPLNMRKTASNERAVISEMPNIYN